MIVVQRTFSVRGDPSAAGISQIAATIEWPVYGFAAVDGNAAITRSITPTSTASTILIDLDDDTYRTQFPDTAATGSADARPFESYVRDALQRGDVDALIVPFTAIYRTPDGRRIGEQRIEALVLPRLELVDRRLGAMAMSAGDRAIGYFVIGRNAYGELRTALDGLAVGRDDRLMLGALCLSTALEQGVPRFSAAAGAVREWLDDDDLGFETDQVVEAIETAFESLTDIALDVPALQVLRVAGTLTLDAGANGTVDPKNFVGYEVSAEWTDVDSAISRSATTQFPIDVAVTDGAAAFSLTDGADAVPIASVDGTVLVSVRSLGTRIWFRQHKPADPTLAALDIQVPLQPPTPRTKPPAPIVDTSLRLRGRVLAFDHACSIKDVLVLVQAKSSADDGWRVVGAATTDATGNFGMPYPYGTYVAASAVVSVAPAERTPIPVDPNGGEESISNDFLYLLVQRPSCDPADEQSGECECDTKHQPNRLPDYADLIGSDEYSQDIGGSCVNLSTPNRTLSEFNFQAIVRTSDPDVATYTLNRRETGLEAIDVSLAAALGAAAEGLRTSAATFRAEAKANFDAMGSVATSYNLKAIEAAWLQVTAVVGALTQGGPPLTATVLGEARHHAQSVSAIIVANNNMMETNDIASPSPAAMRVVRAADELGKLITLAIDTTGTAVQYELAGGAASRLRRPVALDNPVEWQDAPETPLSGALAGSSWLHSIKSRDHAVGSGIALAPSSATAFHTFADRPAAMPPRGAVDATASFAQAVSVATGHILHYKALFKADGYSLGDLIYSLPLAPGQKKEIVVFDSAQTLLGAETQALTQNERLAMGIVDERDITSQLAGNIAEAITGRSSANTSGISAGLGTGGQVQGGNGVVSGGAGAVLGVAGGVAQAGSNASQNGSRDVAQFFGERLRQSILQNAEGYRSLNASVVSSVQQGQRYGVTSEVVANHNHCHALTMMYFEVLRHYAIFQDLSSAEECVFVPFLLTRFNTENIAKWRDVLAPALLPMPSDTYLQPFESLGAGRQHPLIRAFDADQRIRTNYANVDFPSGSYDEEPIRFVKGSVRIRIDLPRPRTRYDRIKSLPIITKTVTSQELDPVGTVKQGWFDSVAAGLTGGLSVLFTGPPGSNIKYTTKEEQIQVKSAIFDSFMTLDANYQSVPPAECIRVTNFAPASISFGGVTVPIPRLDFFLDGVVDRDLWTNYATLLGYSDVVDMLDYYFKGRLIAEWDEIFETDIAPIAFRKIVDSLQLSEFNTDFTTETRYTGGERIIDLFVSGTTSKQRNQLPPQLSLTLGSAAVRALADDITLIVENLRLEYSTAHFRGLLYSGNVNSDLFDGVPLDIPVGADEKRNPRREDRYLAARLIEHLNGNLEHYNRVLWTQLDPERRFMLLDGFSIQVYNDDGTPIPGQAGLRSLASVVKNELVTVVGNALVFPVAPGYRVSGSFIRVSADDDEVVSLLDHYKPLTPIEPYRVSVPSKGVFAEAVQGACNACERIETDRLQDWNRFPIGDEPAQIMPVTVPTPTITDWRAAFQDFATPIVNVQNAPASPAPGAGLQGLSELLGQSNVFRDLTGLDANQQNAIKTYLSNQENAKAFAEMAKDMAMQTHNTQNSGKIMDSITAARTSGSISRDDAGQLTKQHLQQQIDGGASAKAVSDAAQQASTPSLSKAAVEAAGRNKDVTASRVEPGGVAETVTIKGSGDREPLAEVFGRIPRLRQRRNGNDCWAVVTAMMIGWKENNQTITPLEAVTRAGQRYAALYENQRTLPGADKDDFVLRSRMMAEPGASRGPADYAHLLEKFGPLWITTDSVATAEAFSPHARLLIRIAGTGSADGVGTDFTFIDPATGTETTEPFLGFVRGLEEMVTDSRSRSLPPLVVHFVEPIDKGEGYQIEGPFDINAPMHERITLAALMSSTIATPRTVDVGDDQGVNEFLRGVIWNDDPAVLMFDENASTNWDFSWGVSWLVAFKAAERATMNNRTNLTGRSHYWDMQFLHGMAADKGELPHDTLAKILMWAEVTYRLATADGVGAGDRLEDIAMMSSVTDANGTTFGYRLSDFFDDVSAPKGADTISYLLSQDTACASLDLRRRALGSLLHLVQDSYARGHVRRTLLNPGDLMAGSSDTFVAGRFGRYGEIENFHYYRDQDHALHDKYDDPGWFTPRATDLSSFDRLIGGRDAIDACVTLIDMWHSGTNWDAAGGPQEYLEGTVFELSAAATPADATV